MKFHRLTLTSRGSEIQALRDEVAMLRDDLERATRQLARLATPPRPAWIHYSSPIDPEKDFDAEEMPTAQLAVVPDPQLWRIAIDQKNNVWVFRPNWHLYTEYCGPLWAVLYKILEKAGAKRWDSVFVTRDGELLRTDDYTPYVKRENPVTPLPPSLIPDRSRSLV